MEIEYIHAAPDSLLPVRSLKNSDIYADLSSRDLTWKEKNYLCLMVLGRQGITKMSKTDVINRYSLSESFFKNSLATPEETGCCSVGRGEPPLVDPVRLEQVATQTTKDRRGQGKGQPPKPPSHKRFTELLTKAARATAVARRKPLPGNWTLSKKSRASLTKRGDTNKKQTSVHTTARDAATKCPLMVYQWLRTTV